MIRRVVLASAAATLAGILATGPALAQESIDSGEWAGSGVTRPAPVTTDPGSTIVEGRFQRAQEFSRPDVHVVVTAPSGLHPTCPHLDPRSIPATVTSEGRSELFASAYRFNAGVPFGPRVCNGTYGVTVVADVAGSEAPTLTTTIDVAVPPVPVVGVTAERVDGRTVRVSWTPPADPPPDLLGYRVIRTSSTGDVTTFTISDPAATEHLDTDPPAEGGETSYQVVARRSAPGGEVESTGGEAAAPVTVDPAPAADPDDPDDPDGDGGSGPGTTAGPPGSSGGSGTPGRPSRVRPPLTGTSSGFPPRAAPSPTTLDTGFDETLPFEDRELGDADPVLPDDLASQIFDEEPGRGLAIPLATALVLAVWAFHLRFLAKASRPVS